VKWRVQGWPSDLEFTAGVSAGFTTYDGSALQTGKVGNYSTPFQSFATLNAILSPMATSLTAGVWTPAHGKWSANTTGDKLSEVCHSRSDTVVCC
jgi:hypothetical protein